MELYNEMIQLRDFILDKNPYLNKGYANAFKDKESKFILVRDISGDMRSVFPNDYDGDYFYLRNDDGIAYREVASISDRSRTFDDVVNVSLVAVMNNADAVVLSQNLRQSIMKYSREFIPTSGNWNREQIVIDEMSGSDENEILKALQNLDKQTIVRIRFQASLRFIPDNCPFVNPCSC